MHTSVIMKLALLGLQFAVGSALTPTQDRALDWNTMLDGSLGAMPAMVLISYGALAALNNTTPSLASRSEISSSPASPSSAPANRDKDNGAVLAGFIGTAIAAPLKIEQGGMLKGICQTLVGGATAMASTVIGQEVGRGIYGTNSSAADIEEGMVPGAFISGPIGGYVGAQLGTSLCEIGAANITEFLKDLTDIEREMARATLDQGLSQIVNAAMQDLGVEPARAVSFANHMVQGLRYIHLNGPASSLDHMTRELTRIAAQLATSLADGTTALTLPAIGALAAWGTMNGAALGLPAVAPAASTVMAAAPALGALQVLSGQMTNVLSFASSLSAAAGSTPQAYLAAETLQNGLTQAAADVASHPSKSGLRVVAKEGIHKAGKLASTFLDTLDRVRPIQGQCKAKGHTSTTTAIVTRVQVSTVTQKHTRTITREHTSTATVHDIPWRISTVTETETKTETKTKKKYKTKWTTWTEYETVTESAAPAAATSKYRPCPYPGQIC